MKDRKTMFRIFTIAEWEKEQDFLREQHKNGWKFINLTIPCAYHFERCDPEDVIYQLDYNPEGIAHKDEYITMFRDCGWEYLQDFAGYSYFRKPVTAMQGGEEEIFCDDESRLEMIKRVIKGRGVPLIVIFFFCIIPHLLGGVFSTGEHDSSTIIISCLFGFMFLLYGTIFAWFAYKFVKLRKTLR